MPEPISTAVVGYGYAGRAFHAYLVSLEPGLRLTAVSSRDPKRRECARADYGVRTYETLEELLEKDEARLIIVATPHDTHEKLVVAALEAGRHVVVDKAMCLTTEEADRMIAAAERRRVMLSVFHNRRWDGDYLTLRKTIDSGLLGEVYLIEECVMGYHGVGGWRGVKAQGGGPLYDWGAHLVDHGVQIAGSPPAWVFCDTQRQKWATDVETYVKCLTKFRNGLLYSVEVGYLARTTKPKFFALGTEGSFRKEGLDPQEGYMNQKRIEESREDPAMRATVRTTVNGLDAEVRPETVRGDWRQFYRNIAAHLLRGEDLAIKPRDVRENIRVIEAAMRSAQEHRVVNL
ncbi:MAG: Gfo/Idh/MocA family oxidoreductase [Planctomycetes bacterium]|nr:Gfo/Idh/MocA family oxidoreductase [Planctomycetota bacterium]